MQRRKFLHGMGAGVFGAMAGSVPLQTARANPITSPYRVLEINLRGGLSAFDTVLWSERFYDPLRTTTAGVAEIAEGVLDEEMLDGIAGNDIPATAVGHPNQYIWASSHALGPLVSNPLFNDRWRIVCMQHDFEPHPVAIPYALTGTGLGRPFHAGMGAWVKAHTTSGPTEPAYVFYTASGVPNALIAAQPNGLGGAAYPVLMPFDGGADTGLYQRSPQPADGVVQALQAEYENRLQFNAGVNSADYLSYQASRAALEDATNNIQTPVLAAPGTGATEVEVMVRTAVKMLQNDDARYICVVDEGGYDTHGYNPIYHGGLTHGGYHRNQLNKALAGLDELTGLDLDSIMVIVTTEFGRYRLPLSPTGSTSSHWTRGYAQFVIGGETGTEAASSAETRLVGNITDTGDAVRSLYDNSPGFTPTEFRAAALYAAGIEVDSELSLAAGDAASLYNTIIVN